MVEAAVGGDRNLRPNECRRGDVELAAAEMGEEGCGVEPSVSDSKVVDR